MKNVFKIENDRTLKIGEEVYHKDYIKFFRRFENYIKRCSFTKNIGFIFDDNKGEFYIRYDGTDYVLPIKNIPPEELDNVVSYYKKLSSMIDKVHDKEIIIKAVREGNYILNDEQKKVFYDYVSHNNRKNIREILFIIASLLFGVTGFPAFLFLFADSHGLALIIGFFVMSTPAVLGFNAIIDVIDKLPKLIRRIKNNKRLVEELENSSLDKTMFRSTQLEMIDEKIDEPIKYNGLTLNNAMMSNFNNLLMRTSYIINNREKQIIRIKIKSMMKEFLDKFKDMVENNDNGFEIDKISYEKIKKEFAIKLADLEEELNKVIDKQQKLHGIEKDYKAIDSLIDKYLEEDVEEEQVATMGSKR